MGVFSNSGTWVASETLKSYMKDMSVALGSTVKSNDFLEKLSSISRNQSIILRYCCQGHPPDVRVMDCVDNWALTKKASLSLIVSMSR